MTVADYLIGELKAHGFTDGHFETDVFWERFFWDEYDKKKDSDEIDTN